VSAFKLVGDGGIRQVADFGGSGQAALRTILAFVARVFVNLGHLAGSVLEEGCAQVAVAKWLVVVAVKPFQTFVASALHLVEFLMDGHWVRLS
jgi:hypothetical protein